MEGILKAMGEQPGWNTLDEEKQMEIHIWEGKFHLSDNVPMQF